MTSGSMSILSFGTPTILSALSLLLLLLYVNNPSQAGDQITYKKTYSTTIEI